MGKVKSFSAKLAHETSHEGKVFCPTCSTEIKRIKVVLQKSKTSWSPRYEFVKICKCNEADIMSGKDFQA
jgi:hypothetical protein